MEKSVFTSEYAVLIEMLREARLRAKLTQVEVAKRIGETQSFVSKCERGEARIDVIELREFCRAIGVSLSGFIGQFEKRLTKGR